MTSGGPGVSTETISVYIYKVTMLDMEWSYVATVALCILVVLSVVAVPAIKRFSCGAIGTQAMATISLRRLSKQFGAFTAVLTNSICKFGIRN